MSDSFYVTTPIYYVNDLPHIGHAYATIVADALARYHRLLGDPVFFLTGTDEHGQKVEKAARDRGLEPQEHVDRMVLPFKALWQRYEISNDDFIRTTEPRHERVVQQIFQRLYDQGDIYKGHYEGWYCIHEETFWTEAQLIDGHCPECRRPVEWVKEESYYFSTSKYAGRLLEHIKANPGFIRPEVRRNEVVSFIEGGVQDVAVSRTAFRWGVPVPFDPRHVVYVWFDALINYLTGIGYLQDQAQFERFWPPVHVLGKDILKFHAVIWPSMLLALGVTPPKVIMTTGFWTLGAQKISKSTGVVIDPTELADELGVDAVRYFLIREVPLGQDGEFTKRALIRRVNDDLANDLGNLLHRTLPMIERYREGRVPAARATARTAGLKSATEGIIARFRECMDDLDPRSALIEVWKILALANKFIDEAAPWALHKEGKADELDEVLSALAETIRLVALLISPVMPGAARGIFTQLGLEADPAAELYADSLNWGRLPAGIAVKRGAPLFPRVEEAEEE